MPRGGRRDGAGRKEGSTNKVKAELRELLEEVYPDYDPVLAMAALANDQTADPFMRFQASKEVAQYVHAKRKAIDITTGGSKLATEVILPHVTGQ